MSATESTPQPQRPQAISAGVSMRDLLASCAAASAVSTPPSLPDSGTTTARPPAGHREAA